MLIVDMRCPVCNCPVIRGSKEIITAERLPDDAPSDCIECGVRVRLVKTEYGTECPMYHFSGGPNARVAYREPS